MSLLRQRIMDSAMRFFTEKGYYATSIQDIANDCAIAKGSLYKIFPSKDDLLIEVLGERLLLLREQTERIVSDSKYSPKDRFVKETLLQLEFIAEYKLNFRAEHDLPTLENGGKLKSFAAGLKTKLTKYYADCVVRAYGPEVEPYKWDFVVILVGMMKQYMTFGYFVNSRFDLNRIANYIADRMDEITAGVLEKKPQPLFDSSTIARFLGFSEGEATSSPEQLRADLIQHLEAAIQELAVPQTRKVDLLDAVGIIKEQLALEDAKPVLIRAMLNYLSDQHELASYAGQLERAWTCEKKRN
jgi:AcrR family transcriptional regulator